MSVSPPAQTPGRGTVGPDQDQRGTVQLPDELREGADQARERLAIDIQQVSRRFGSVNAVVDLSLPVPAGSIVGVIGPSGSGKTTTIRMITGALRPDHGRIRVLGEEPRRFRRATRELIGYMPQQFVLYPDLTARENVDFMGALFGMLIRRRRRRVDEVLSLVDLWEARDRRVSDLSGGMQRRVALASALVHEPTLLILDEPTAGIDPLLRERVWEELRRLRDAGVTVLVTTQYVSEAEYCEWVALISAGELIAYDTPESVRRQAFGGDVMEVGTREAFDAKRLPSLPGVLEVRQVGPREMLVIASEAGTAMPAVVDAIDEAGGDVEWSREHRPTFDEVFAVLVNRHTGDEMPGGGGTFTGLRFPSERQR